MGIVKNASRLVMNANTSEETAFRGSKPAIRAVSLVSALSDPLHPPFLSVLKSSLLFPSAVRSFLFSLSLFPITGMLETEDSHHPPRCG